MRKIVSKERKGNLIEVNLTDIHLYSHLFREEDFEGVQELVRYLHKTGLDSYLAGSAVNGWIFDGNTNYRDIDLIAVPNKKEDPRIKVVKQFDDLEKNRAGIKLGEVIYHIAPEKKGMYVGDSIDCRFILTPERYAEVNSLISDDRKVISPAQIDLSLVSKRKFIESLK